VTDPASPNLNPGADTQPFVPAAPEPAAPIAEPAAPIAEPVVPGAVTPGTARKPGSSMWVNAALALALAVALAGVGFAAGRMTAPTSALGGNGGAGRFGNGNFPGGAYFQGGAGGANAGGRGGFLGGGGASVQGTVESISADTLTLKLSTGQTVQIALSGTTTYHAETTATAGDVKTGGNVIVRIQIDRGQEGAVAPSASDITIVP